MNSPPSGRPTTCCTGCLVFEAHARALIATIASAATLNRGMFRAVLMTLSLTRRVVINFMHVVPHHLLAQHHLVSIDARAIVPRRDRKPIALREFPRANHQLAIIVPRPDPAIA